MKQFLLDGAAVSDRDHLHKLLANGLGFPTWYGHNLDALYDCLTDLEETSLQIDHIAQLKDTLGAYGRAFLHVLQDAAEENPKLHLFCDGHS